MFSLSVPDCLLDPMRGYPIALFCIIVFTYYCRIARQWLKAAKRYSTDRLQNPWFIQAVIFVACGICGYLTIPLSFFSIALSANLKLAMLIVITVASELFLSNFAVDSIKVAKEASVGKSVLFLSDQVASGLIDPETALSLLQKESNEIGAMFSTLGNSKKAEEDL